MDASWLIYVRALHLLAAAFWLGAAALLTLYVMPAIRHTGSAGGAVLVETVRRGVGVFMPSVAGLTLLTGLLLFWNWYRVHGGLHGGGALLLTIGAFAGVIGAMVGGGVLGRTVQQLAELAAAPPGDATATRIAALHRRGATVSRFVLALLVAAILLMIFSRAF